MTESGDGSPAPMDVEVRRARRLILFGAGPIALICFGLSALGVSAVPQIDAETLFWGIGFPLLVFALLMTAAGSEPERASKAGRDADPVASAWILVFAYPLLALLPLGLAFSEVIGDERFVLGGAVVGAWAMMLAGAVRAPIGTRVARVLLGGSLTGQQAAYAQRRLSFGCAVLGVVGIGLTLIGAFAVLPAASLAALVPTFGALVLVVYLRRGITRSEG